MGFPPIDSELQFGVEEARLNAMNDDPWRSQDRDNVVRVPARQTGELTILLGVVQIPAFPKGGRYIRFEGNEEWAVSLGIVPMEEWDPEPGESFWLQWLFPGEHMKCMIERVEISPDDRCRVKFIVTRR